MTDEESIFDLPRERLDLIDHDVYKWVCSVEGCDCGTHVRDYGVAPFYYHPRKSIAWFHGDDYWWFCSKHWPMARKDMPLTLKENYKAVNCLVFIKSVTINDLKLHE